MEGAVPSVTSKRSGRKKKTADMSIEKKEN